MLELAPEGNDLYKAGFAGDTFNTVWYVAQISRGSISPAYLTAVGDDATSREMVDFIKAAGIAPLVKTRTGKSVGLYKISVKNGERSFSYWRSDSAARTLASDIGDLPVARGDIVYFSGITLAILPPDDRKKLIEALLSAKSNGALVVFDPNLRPRLWNTTEDMKDWTTKGAEIAEICLPSFEDESVYFGDSTPEDTCARYASNGSPIVVVKNGPQPVVLLENGVRQEVDIAPVANVVDTTAAGDSFNAMLLLKYAEGMPIADAVSLASRLSAEVISKPGALVRLDH